MDIGQDIKTILNFFQSLGIERLPIEIPTGKDLLAVTKSKDSEFKAPEPRTLNPELSSSHDKKAALKKLREEIGECQRCKLSKERKHIVFGEGSPDAGLMFIGEAPGKEEDIQARPFVGDAGKLLTRMIEKMGLAREDVYIGNIVKCRPPLNRDPEEDEMKTCSPFIDRQIEIISPKVIVSLGRVSAQTLIATKIPISKLRGRFYEYKGIPLMPTFHPAYLLRNPKDKWLV
ncbi:MAG TPA: uracil-DNA glycosylase, partial [Thermodesulfovibrionales bacterium]|nr:uracil-DNA glycosylase [Thermodesulfovibrionales bacterium]